MANFLGDLFNGGCNLAIKGTDTFRQISLELTKAKDTIKRAELFMIIGAVALTALGIILACTPAGPVAVIPFLLTSVLVYGIYNLERVKTNIDDIISNPGQLVTGNLETLINVSAGIIKNKLKEKTFCFDWAVDYAFDNSRLGKSLKN